MKEEFDEIEEFEKEQQQMENSYCYMGVLK